MIQCNCFRWGFFFSVYIRGVRWLVLFGKQQKHGSYVREDDVEDEQSASKAITALIIVSEQGRGVGNDSLCLQPRSHQVWQWMSQGETMKEPKKNLSFSKSHNLGRKEIEALIKRSSNMFYS